METVIAFFATVALTTLGLLMMFNFRTRAAIERYRMKPNYGIHDPLFRRSIAGILAESFIDGNRIQTLNGGQEIFSSMIAEIKRAQKSITLESFVCSSGAVCQEFIAALKERASVGVCVSVLLDWMGSTDLQDEHYRAMQRAGIRVVKYRKPHWYTLPRLNNRSHRKILVVDGRVGFTGGAGIADQWRHERNGFPAWRDIHYRIEGPIIARMQAAFQENWLKSHSSILDGDTYFPEQHPAGDLEAQLFTSSADGIEAVRLMYLFSIACARKSIRILNAYFVPDKGLTQALIQAMHRGVKIEILVPGDRTDQRILREVSRSTWKQLLKAGIPIYEYQPTMHHAKLFIVDDAWTSIGSANCDGRSFGINDEMNINILDASFAQEQIRLFEEDKRQSHLVTFKEWKRRPFWRKALGNTARIIRGQF